MNKDDGYGNRSLGGVPKMLATLVLDWASYLGYLSTLGCPMGMSSKQTPMGSCLRHLVSLVTLP